MYMCLVWMLSLIVSKDPVGVVQAAEKEAHNEGQGELGVHLARNSTTGGCKRCA